MTKELRDVSAERALLGTIIKYGKDSFIDADAIVSSNDFSLLVNRAIYTTIKTLIEDPNFEKFDIETLKLKMRAIGFQDLLNSKKELEYIELLSSVNFDITNVQIFAYQIKKYSVIRELYSRYSDAKGYLEGLEGNETLSEIIQKAESKVVDFIGGTENFNSIKSLTNDLEEYVQNIIDSDVITQVGLPTGFPLWDSAIGGGLRRGTVTFKCSRSKKGKSFDAMNIALNIAKLKVPVLYLDSELTEEYQKARMICIKSECPLTLYETRKFKENKGYLQAVKEAARELKQTKFYYESIGGLSSSEVLAMARRWLIKHVGFDNNGRLNDCLIVYDYIKITDGNQLTKHTPEYLVIGLMMSELHNFSVKYDLPILLYGQLNRDGIEGEDTDIVAQSDRLLWLCSSLSIFKDKDENDLELGGGWETGNKKLIVLETRHGAGMDYGDYINLHASLRPNVSMDKGCGRIREGFAYSDFCRQRLNG